MLNRQKDPLVDALCTLIRTGELSPGERVDQRAISERLDVSRTPLREALRALAMDGILVHTPNAGYAVAKLSAVELFQYYSIRAYLEGEVLRSIEWPTASQLDGLREINRRCFQAAASGTLEELSRANHDFHYEILKWSPLKVLVNDLERIWRVTDPYRALHLSNPNRRGNVAPDHDEMIDAIEARDADLLITLMDRHRGTSRIMLENMLGPPVPEAVLALPQTAEELRRLPTPVKR